MVDFEDEDNVCVLKIITKSTTTAYGNGQKTGAAILFTSNSSALVTTDDGVHVVATVNTPATDGISSVELNGINYNTATTFTAKGDEANFNCTVTSAGDENGGWKAECVGTVIQWKTAWANSNEHQVTVRDLHKFGHTIWTSIEDGSAGGYGFGTLPDTPDIESTYDLSLIHI